MATFNIGKYFSKPYLWQLFVAAAFPLHIWTIILVLMDISWVAERTNYWDAVGVAAYGLVFTFFESMLIWLVLIILGVVLPKEWSISKRVALLGVFAFAAALWAIFGQLYFLLEWSLPEWIILFLARQSHPLRLLYVIYLAVISLTVVLAAYFAVFSSKFQAGITALIDRLSILMWFYLFLDCVSILIVLFRNIG